MSATKTRIAWTDATWNPVTGCTKVSAGCKNCYAEAIAKRWWKGRPFTEVRIHPDRLDEPLSWRKPKRVFVNSMSDLFHEAVPDEFIDLVFAVMAVATRHTFQVLTKRPARMRDYLAREDLRFRIARATMHLPTSNALLDGVAQQVLWSDVGSACGISRWPLPNVWLGVSCENQETADERIPLLLDTPAAVRFLSVEPMLAPVKVGALRDDRRRNGIHWVICGGESGPGHRPMDLNWARVLRAECGAAGIAFFFKQTGGARPGTSEDALGELVQEFPAGGIGGR